MKFCRRQLLMTAPMIAASGFQDHVCFAVWAQQSDKFLEAFFIIAKLVVGAYGMNIDIQTGFTYVNTNIYWRGGEPIGIILTLYS